MRFIREIQKAKANDFGLLVRALQKYPVDLPGDQFEVEFRGERIVVKRQDIEEMP